MAVVTCVRRGEERGRRVIAECNDRTASDCVHVIEYEGAVLSRREHNGYDDSDFYATVYDAEADEVRSVMYATTRGWTYHNSATVDADEATIEAAVAAVRRRNEEGVRSEVEALVAQMERGCRARFTRSYNARKLGRRIEADTEATVFWYGDNRYGYGMRAGVELEDGTRLFLDAAALERTDIEEIDTTEVEARLDQIAANARYGFNRQRTREAVAA